MKHTPLQWKFSLALIAIVVLISAALSLYFATMFRNTYENLVKDRLTNEAMLLGEDITQMGHIPITASALNPLVSTFSTLLKVRVTIIQPDGKVVADSEADPASMDNHLTRPEVIQAVNGQVGFQKRYSNTLHTDFLYVAIGQKEGNSLVRIIRLSEPMTTFDLLIKRVNRTIWIGSAILILLASLTSLVLSKRIVQPIQNLTQAANRLSQGNFDMLPESNARNELGELTRSFSTMALQIRNQIQTIDSEKQVISGIVEKMMDGIVICAQDGTIQMINPAARRMFDIGSEETVIGIPLVGEIHYYQVTDLVKQTLDSGKSQNTTMDLKAYKKYLYVMTTLLEYEDRYSVLLLFQDLTYQRNLEKVRQEFVSNVSHELRTPLASLQVLTETLQDGALDDKPAAMHFLSRMQVEIEKLTQMVMELLDLSSIESGRVALKKTLVNIRDLLVSPVERMTPQVIRAGLTIELDAVGDLPEVMVDVDRMEQVLINLIHNAIKFTPAPGKITVSAHVENSKMILKVSDTGVGISEEDLPRIFERFYKTDRARASGGTGLGLAIAKHVVEAHGGKISAESYPGNGTTFIIDLPL